MKHTVVVGASTNEERYSNKAVKLLKLHGHQVTAIGQQKGNINGIEINPFNTPVQHVDTLSIYLSPKNQIPYYDYFINLKPLRVIFNPGTENPELQALLDDHGIHYEEACTLVLLNTHQF